MFKRLFVILLILTVSGCSRAGNEGYTAGDIRAKNHVAGQSINWFKVNGYFVSGLGGGVCCIMLPLKWTPDLKAHIDWEVDLEPYAKLPPLGTDEFRKAYIKHAGNYRKYSTIVDIPEYGKSRCGISVHFLPCNQVKVTTACVGYGTPNYPIKEPMNMKEPAQCPQ